MDISLQRETLVAELGHVAGGEARALEAVYRLTSAKLFGICIRIVGDAGEAEDVLHDVYMTVWRRAASFDASRASPITWLATIARNRAIDHRRRRSPLSAPIDEAYGLPDPGPSPATVLEETQSARRLAHCLEELEPPQRQAISRAFLDGRTYESVAIEAGVPVGTMKSRIRRALLKLRGCLGQ